MRRFPTLLLLSLLVAGAAPSAARTMPAEIIIDTDLGDDLDDAFALALALSSPELRLDGITTSLGDTGLRARMARRLLRLVGRTDIPVSAGPATRPYTRFTQSAWASAEPSGPVPPAVDVTLDRLHATPPGRITLVALAPLTTVGAMIDRDPAAFRRLAQVVVMGGSIRRGYGRRAGTNSASPSIEYNVRCDPAGLRRLLASGVPVVLMPLDATEIALDRAARAQLFATRTPLAAWLDALYPPWANGNPWGPDPTLFDVVPVAWLLRPSICTPVPLRIAVSPSGATTIGAGPPNARACLGIDRAAVLGLLQDRLARPG